MQGISAVTHHRQTAALSRAILGICRLDRTQDRAHIFPSAVVSALQDQFAFYVWRKTKDERTLIRLVTSCATMEQEVDSFLERLRALSDAR